MPTFFRFIIIVGSILATTYAGLYVLATKFEPKPKEVQYSIGTLKIRKQ
jgi:hypothetical protein